MAGRGDQDGVVLGLVWPAAESVRRIADAMADVAAMRAPDLRQQMLTWVKQRNRAFDPRRSNRDLEEITNFIVACRDDDESFDLGHRTRAGAPAASRAAASAAAGIGGLVPPAGSGRPGPGASRRRWPAWPAATWS